MALPAQKFREAVFQLLFSSDAGHATEENMLPLLMHELSTTKKTVRTAQERVHKILEKKSEIDQMITKTSQSYEFERIQDVERNILRLGVFELFYDDNIPPKVAIAEAVRLARKFATPESAAFVNAILDALYKASLGEKMDASQINQSLKDLEKSEKLAKKAIDDSLNKNRENED